MGNSLEFSEATRRWMDSGSRIRVGDHSVFVYVRGEGANVILIHGFPTSCYDWRGTIDILKNKFRCVAFDLLGFGLSDKPEAFSYSLFQQADMIEALVRIQNIEEAHVISHDMGTSAHTELLRRQQEGRLGFRLLSSTFLNGSLIKDMAKLTDFQRMLEDPQQLEKAIRFCSEMASLYVPSLKKIMKKPETISDADAIVMNELLAYQNGNLRLPNVYAYVRERYLHKERWLGAIRDARTPVQFIWATGDPIATLEMGRALSAMAPEADYTEVEGIGHFIPIEAPEKVAASFLSFAEKAGSK